MESSFFLTSLGVILMPFDASNPTWYDVFRDGFAPLLLTEQLVALRDALLNDDERLVQGRTTTPPGRDEVADWPVEAACLFGYCGVHAHGGFGTATVDDVNEFFANLCFEVDRRLGEPAACRFALNFFDDTPRDEMRKWMLVEVDAVLAGREPLTEGNR